MILCIQEGGIREGRFQRSSWSGMKMAHAGYVRGALLRLGSGHTVSVVYLVVRERNYPQGADLHVSSGCSMHLLSVE
jgi:hypothetical protein